MCSGGTKVTVTGSRLDSVAVPRINVTVVISTPDNDSISTASNSQVLVSNIFEINKMLPEQKIIKHVAPERPTVVFVPARGLQRAAGNCLLVLDKCVVPWFSPRCVPLWICHKKWSDIHFK